MANPFLVDDNPPQFPQGLQSNQQAIQQNSGLSSAIQSGIQMPHPDQPTPPGRVKSMLTGFLQGISDGLKKDAGLETSAEYQQRMLNNQMKQQQLQQFDTVAYQMPDGTTVQVQRKDMGSLAGRIGASGNQLQGKLAGVNATLAAHGFQLGEDGQLAPIPREKLSELQRSQIDTNTAKQGLTNAQADLASAKAKGVPALIAVAQAKVRAYQQAVNAQSQNANTNTFNAQTKRDEFQSKYGVTTNPDGSKSVGSEFLRLNPHSQQVLAETQPKIEQIKNLLKELEPEKNDDSRGAYLADRLAYATGSAGDDSMAKRIADLELGKIQNSAALAKGNTRNYQFIQDIYKHQPNLYVDSKKLVHEKLTNILTNLQRIEDGAIKFGDKQGLVKKSDLNGGFTPKTFQPDNP